MRIGINLLAIKPHISGGIEIYIMFLLKYLAQYDHENIYFLFTNIDNFSTFDLEASNFQRLRIRIFSKQKLLRVLFEQIMLPVIGRKLKLDLIYSPSYVFPILSNIGSVITISDMLFMNYPSAVDRLKRVYLRLLLPIAAKRCRKILTLSKFSKKDIMRYLKICSGKIIVTPLALDPELGIVDKQRMEDIAVVLEKYGIKRPYILTVGGVGIHKNAISLIKGLKLLHEREGMGNLKLVIIGRDYGFKFHIDAEIDKLAMGNSVYFPGYVSKGELAAFYSGAEAYASASYFEGFGLTVLEAMKFGIPIIISDRSSLPEVAEDAAIYIDPGNPGELADAIYKVLSDEKIRGHLVNKGYMRLRDFSWKKTAYVTLKVFAAVGGKEFNGFS